MPIYEITKWNGGISDFENRGISGAFKFGSNLNIRKTTDSLSCNQALVDEGILSSASPSSSVSPSASTSPSASPSSTASPSASTSPSSSPSSSQSASTGISPSPSRSPSASASPSASVSPSSSISPSPSPSGAVSSVFKGLILFFVKARDGYTYGFDDQGYIYRRDLSGFWVQVYKDPDGKIKGAEEGYSDDGKTYLAWTTDSKVKKKIIPGLSNWNDVEIVGSLDSYDWHTMKQVAGSVLICNGSKMAMIGYDQSYTPEALDLVPGNISKTIVERNGRAIIGTVPTSRPTRGVNAAIDTEVPMSQIGDDGELFYANMSDSIPLTRFPGGGVVNPGGVANEVDQANFFEWEQGALSWIDKQEVGNLSLWGVYNADTNRNGVYSYGRKKKNQQITLNLEYALEVDEIGAVISTNGVTLVSYRDGSDYGVKSVSDSVKATGTYEGLDFSSPVKGPSEITPWKYAEVFCDPLPSGASVEFWYKLNKTGDFVRAKTADGQDSFSTAGGKKAVFRIGAEAEIFQPKLVLNPSGNNDPQIYRLRVYFD